MLWTGKAYTTKRRLFGAHRWIAAGIIGASLLSGCGGGGANDGGSSAEERLPGTWRVARLEAAGQSTACAGEINFVENGDETSVSCGANDTVTFFENGAFTGTSAGGGAFAGTWQLSESSLTITITTPNTLAATERESVHFSDDNTFTSESEDKTISTFVRQ